MDRRFRFSRWVPRFIAERKKSLFWKPQNLLFSSTRKSSTCLATWTTLCSYPQWRWQHWSLRTSERESCSPTQCHQSSTFHWDWTAARMSGEVKVAATGMWLGIGNGVNLQIRDCVEMRNFAGFQGTLVAAERNDFIGRYIFIYVWRPVMRMKYWWTFCDPVCYNVDFE